MEHEAEAGPSRLPYSPDGLGSESKHSRSAEGGQDAAQFSTSFVAPTSPSNAAGARLRRSSRTLRTPSRETIPIIERQGVEKMDTNTASNPQDGAADDAKQASEADAPSEGDAAAKPSMLLRRGAKRKSDQLHDPQEDDDGRPDTSSETEQATQVPEELASKRLKEAEAGTGTPGVEDDRGVTVPANVEPPEGQQEEDGASSSPASLSQSQQAVEARFDNGMEAIDLGQDASICAAEQEGGRQEMDIAHDEHAVAVKDPTGEPAVAPSSHTEDESAPCLDLVGQVEDLYKPSTIPSSLPLPRAHLALREIRSFQSRSLSSSAIKLSPHAEIKPLIWPPGQASQQDHAPLSQSEPAPISPAAQHGILDELHQIGDEISQKSEWERDEEGQVGRTAEGLQGQDDRVQETPLVAADRAQVGQLDKCATACEPAEKSSQPLEAIAEDDLVQGATRPEAQSAAKALDADQLQPAAATRGGMVEEAMETAAESSSASNPPVDDSLVQSQWSEEPWQAPDPFKTSQPAQYRDTAMDNSSSTSSRSASPEREEDSSTQQYALAPSPLRALLSRPLSPLAEDEAGPSHRPHQPLPQRTAGSPTFSQKRRQFSRSISRRSRGSFDGEGYGDAFWDEVIDTTADEHCVAGAGGAESGEDWDLGDADLTLSQIDHDDGAADFSDGIDGEAAMPQPIPAGAFAGFSTAANRRLPEPDAKAMERARRAFEVDDAEREIHRMAAAKPPRRAEPTSSAATTAPAPPPPRPAATQRNPAAMNGEQQEDSDYEDDDHHTQEELPAVIPQFVSFQKANGAALQLSKTAMLEAEKRMAQWEAEHDAKGGESSKAGASISRPSTPLPARLNSAVSQAGSARSPLAPTSSPHTNRIVDATGDESLESAKTSTTEESVRIAPPSARTGSQRSSQPTLRTDADSGQTPRTPATSSIALPALSAARVTAAVVPPTQQMVTPLRPAPNRAAFSTSSVPHNSNAASSSSLSSSFHSPGAAASPAPRRPRLDARPSRISLGMTPRAKVGAGGSSRSVFKTPFKGGANGMDGGSARRPSLTTSISAMAAPQSPFVAPSMGKAFAGPSRTSLSPTKLPPTKPVARAALAPTASNQSVFDLAAPAEGRLGLNQYGMLPASRPRPGQQRPCLPSEIAAILRNPTEAGRYAFRLADSGEAFGIRHALAELHRRGAMHVDEAWVRNHWVLILWKLAAYVQAQAYNAGWSVSVEEACEKWWNFETALKQLLYRYEREVNLAQRSVLKRVHEHDSSSVLPMVLLVMAIRSPQEGEASRGPTLDLTDGWYRIIAQLDEPLSRAVGRGKIRAGQKIALQGARLASSEPGGGQVGPRDPLNGGAQCLSLCGNGTSLATWDAKLGARNEPMVATLRSLTADGGTVPCMDIMITRLFPVAYCDGGGGGGGGGGGNNAGSGAGGPSSSTPNFGRWGAAEEAEAQREWEKRYEDCRARLEAEAEKQAKGVADLQDLLAGYLEGAADGAEEEDYDDAADVTASHLFDELSSASNTSEAGQALRRGLTDVDVAKKRSIIRRLVELTGARAESLRLQWSSDVEGQLAKMCPRRRVRSFRVCRFVDTASSMAEDGAPSTLRRSCKRTVQLTIWDVDGLGAGGGAPSSSSGSVGEGGGSRLAAGGPGSSDDFLAQGRRYRVTNLMPAQRYAWRGADVAADVFLATRRDSQWRRM